MQITLWFLLYSFSLLKTTLLWETNAAYDLIYCKQPFFVMVWVFKIVCSNATHPKHASDFL